jgi:hypothetical protein
MQAWLPVVGTLAGAIVAAVISFILHGASNRHAMRVLKTNLSEDRARWAAEHELSRIQTFYGTIEQLVEAAVSFRIRQAWEARGGKPVPSWVLSAKDAREGIQTPLESAYSAISLLSLDIQTKFEKTTEHYRKWYLSDTREEGLEHLVRLEHDLEIFKKALGERYRQIFDARRSGSDLISSE